MSKVPQAPVLTGVPDVEVIQFTCKGVYTVRDSSGRVASTQEATVTVTQAQFGVTLQTLADQLVAKIEADRAKATTHG